MIIHENDGKKDVSFDKTMDDIHVTADTDVSVPSAKRDIVFIEADLRKATISTSTVQDVLTDNF